MLYKYLAITVGLVIGLLIAYSVLSIVGGLVIGPLVSFIFTKPLLFIGVLALLFLSMIWIDKKIDVEEGG